MKIRGLIALAALVGLCALGAGPATLSTGTARAATLEFKCPTSGCMVYRSACNRRARRLQAPGKVVRFRCLTGPSA
jgi:hypothetical protein